jgi:hypothetical protein
LDALHYCCDFYTGLSFSNKPCCLNGLIGSAPGKSILKECIENMQRPEDAQNTFHAILKRTGPYFFTRHVTKNILTSSDRIVLFPVTYFYPWPYYHRGKNNPEQIKKWIQPESFGIHHWFVSWNQGVAHDL